MNDQSNKKSNVVPMRQKITPNMEPDILVWAAEEGSTLNEVLKKLKDKWAVTVDKSTISRLINSRKMERTEITQQVLRENLGKFVVGDLEILQGLKAELLEDRAKLRGKDDIKLANECADRVIKLVDMSMKLSGAQDKHNTNEEETAAQSLLAKMDAAAKANRGV